MHPEKTAEGPLTPGLVFRNAAGASANGGFKGGD